MNPRRRARRAALLVAAVVALVGLGALATACGPSASTVKANAQQARKAMDDVVYYDVELLLVPTVVMRTTEPTASVTASQTVAMKAWLAKDLAIIEDRAKTLANMAKSPALGDAASDDLLKANSMWLDRNYLPAIRKAAAADWTGRSLGDVETALGSPWAGKAGEAAKGAIARFRAALAKKAGT